MENKIDACLQLSHCYRALGNNHQAFLALLHSFMLDLPRPEICCLIGSLLMDRQEYRQAIYWYEQALSNPSMKVPGGFSKRFSGLYSPYTIVRLL